MVRSQQSLFYAAQIIQSIATMVEHQPSLLDHRLRETYMILFKNDYIHIR